MEKRPKLKIEPTKTDKIGELIGWFIIITMWGLTITNYKNLPDIIPTHFNASGVIDGFGEKKTLLSLPIISTFLFIGLTILNKFPHIFNYLTTITKDNALRQYTISTRIIRYLKVIIVLIFEIITFKTIQIANGESNGLGYWFFPFTIGIIFIPLAYMVIKSLKAK